MEPTESRHVALVGAGPRGLSVLERIGAHERARPAPTPLLVHVVDPAAPGPGAVWRSAQSRHLLMNTVASQVTVYTDDSVTIEGPIEPGPSLYEWAREVAARGALPGPDVGEGPPDPAEEAAVVTEAAALGPDTYPTRAFYGHYLRDCWARIVAGMPEHVTVRAHRTRAVAASDIYGLRRGPQGLRLENGERLEPLEGMVLAQGHLPARLTRTEERTASLSRVHRLTYLPPANPADLDVDHVAPGETVLVRGLGLNFCDLMAVFTVGRGGRFEPGAGGGLRYVRSGREPRIVAFSRRGVPYHARGENQKGAHGRHHPRVITPEVVAALRDRRGRGEHVRFGEDVWPLIALEVESVHYGLLVAALGGDREAFVDRFVAADAAGRAALLDGYGIPPERRWDWRRVEDPCADLDFADRDAFRTWLLGHLGDDLAAARAGNVDDPLKAALDVLRDLRNEIRLVVDHGGIEGDSYRRELQGWYTPLNAYLSIGPPAHRVEQMIALLRDGLLEITGPGTEVRIDPDRPAFVATSSRVPGPPERGTTLIEARLPEPDLRRTEDPLMLQMQRTGQCTAYRIPAEGGDSYETGGLAVTERPYRIVDDDGRPHPRRFALGVPTEAVHWVTAAGVRPGVDSVSLGDADAIARALLTLPVASVLRDPAPRVDGEPADPLWVADERSAGLVV